MSFSQPTATEAHSASASAPHVKHGKNPEHIFSPELSVTKTTAMQAFVQAPLTGRLDDVPGIGAGNVNHLNTDGIYNSFQLVGKFLMMRDLKLTCRDNVQNFFAWLREKGVVSHTHDITMAIAEKANLSFGGGFYNEADYQEK